MDRVRKTLLFLNGLGDLLKDKMTVAIPVMEYKDALKTGSRKKNWNDQRLSKTFTSSAERLGTKVLEVFL